MLNNKWQTMTAAYLPYTASFRLTHCCTLKASRHKAMAIRIPCSRNSWLARAVNAAGFRNFTGTITELRVSPDLSSATVERVITDDAFEVPTTVARWGNRLATVNAKFDTGFPPSATTFEVVEVNAR